MNPVYKFSIIAGAVIAFYLYAYQCGYSAANAKAQAENARAMAEAGQRLQDLQAESAETIAGYVEALDQINEAHRQEIEALKNEQIADVIEIPVNNVVVDKCPGMRNDKTPDVPATKTKQNLLCYTDADLRGKIARSLDIARECDKLAVKYNALLSDCTALTK